MPVGLSIAGSDSGGGAGIQADVRTMQRLGVFATTAVTALTAQNLDAVTDVQPASPENLAAQIDAVLAGFDVACVKTGMLWSAELIAVVVARVSAIDLPIVVDPVMVATSGARLLTAESVAAYRRLFALAAVVTPNLDEAAVLLGRPLNRAGLLDEARRLRDTVAAPVLLKGGHLDGPPIDVLAGVDGDVAGWEHDRVEQANTHGSGCMLSSAIAAGIAHGRSLDSACADALAFVHDAIARGAAAGGLRLADIESARADRTHLRRIE